MRRFISLFAFAGIAWMAGAQQVIPWQQLQVYNQGKSPEQILYRHSAGLQPSANPVRFAMRSALFFYQQKITYQLPTACMYEPSCSEFSRQCFEEFHPVKALFLSMDRLSRCNRFEAMRQSPYDMISGERKVRFHDPVSRYHFHPTEE